MPPRHPRGRVVGTTTTSLSAANQAQITAEITAVWSQIAAAFNGYGYHLIFECFNEPHGNVNGYSGGDAPSRAILNAYLVACMNAIRGTGGNNATRYVMIQGIGAQAVQVSIQAVVVPNNDPNVLFSVHNYFPWAFADGTTTTWGVASDYTDLSGTLEQILSWLPPTEGIVMGEWGTVSADQLSSRVSYTEAYTQDITKAGPCSVVWDDGGDFILLNRTSTPPLMAVPEHPLRDDGGLPGRARRLGPCTRRFPDLTALRRDRVDAVQRPRVGADRSGSGGSSGGRGARRSTCPAPHKMNRPPLQPARRGSIALTALEKMGLDPHGVDDVCGGNTSCSRGRDGGEKEEATVPQCDHFP